MAKLERTAKTAAPVVSRWEQFCALLIAEVAVCMSLGWGNSKMSAALRGRAAATTYVPRHSWGAAHFYTPHEYSHVHIILGYICG